LSLSTRDLLRLRSILTFTTEYF